MWGLKFSGERHMREKAKQLQSENITSELALFSYSIQGGEELRAQPFVYVPDIIKKITSLLDENAK